MITFMEFLKTSRISFHRTRDVIYLSLKGRYLNFDDKVCRMKSALRKKNRNFQRHFLQIKTSWVCSLVWMRKFMKCSWNSVRVMKSYHKNSILRGTLPSWWIGEKICLGIYWICNWRSIKYRWISRYRSIKQLKRFKGDNLIVSTWHLTV